MNVKVVLNRNDVQIALNRITVATFKGKEVKRCIAQSGKSTTDQNVNKTSDTQPIQYSSKRKREGKANSSDKKQNATAQTAKAKVKTRRCTEVPKEKVIYS